MPTLRSFIKAFELLLRLSEVLELNVTEDGSVVLRHTSGSYIRFRGDGNIDKYATRNLTQNTGRGAILNNCKVLDLYDTKQEIWIAHDRMHNTNLEGRDARGYFTHSSGPNEQHNEQIDYSQPAWLINPLPTIEDAIYEPQKSR